MSGSACTSSCGFCGACSSAWEADEEPYEDVLSDEEQLARDLSEATFDTAIHNFFTRTEPVTK